MNTDVIGYVLAALVAAAASVWIARSSNRANQITSSAQNAVEKVRADGEAYERAQTFNERVVAGLTTELDRLSRELAEVRDELAAERSDKSELRRKVAKLERTVDRMTALLRQNNIEIPVVNGF